MQVPVQVSFHNMEPSEAVEQVVRRKARALDRYFGRITSCRVVIEMPHRRHQQGSLFRVRIDLGVPNGELVVARGPSLHAAHEDVLVAIRDAFRAARRELQEHARRLRADTKRHEPATFGRVARLLDGYGFIQSDDDREIYFHENSVLGAGFDHLAVGDEVRFVEEQGDKGPQASTVVPKTRHHEQFPAPH